MNTIIVGNYEEIENCNFDTDIEYWNYFLFDKFKLIFNLKNYGKIKCVVELKDRTCVQVRKYIDSDYPEGYDFTIGYDNIESYNIKTGEVTYDKWKYDGISGGDNYNRQEIIDNIMKYIMYNVENRNKTTKEITHKNSEVKLIKRRNISSTKKVFLLNELYNYFYIDKKTDNASKREKQCPCWGVRGHYRHYKSGKTVFIKEYLKGKEKDKVKPKEREYYL